MLQRWNTVQEAIDFRGLRVERNVERQLLIAGAISNDEASNIADSLRRSAGHSTRDDIIIFTEKRLYDDKYDQLYLGGRYKDENPPRIGVLSLDFLRRLYCETGTKSPILFRAILTNILFSIGIDSGLADHDRSRGCVMDFCEEMSDIEKCLGDGPKFCRDHERQLAGSQKTFLLELASTVREFEGLQALDGEVTESIVLRGKRYEQSPDRFDYDIAISYAGEDKLYAEKLACALQDRNIEVFYDEFARADLWGKNLRTHLPELYRLRARYCIVLLSRHYAAKRYTKLELEAALAREFQEDQEYVLPVRLDDTEIEGILPTRAHIDWGNETPESLAALAAKKLG